jgi:ADP-ribose pyrophosphatase
LISVGDPDLTDEGRGLELRPWEVLDRECLVDATPWMQVWKETVRLPDGRTVDDFYTVDQPDHVMVFAVTTDDRVICLWHYKHGSRDVNLSFPAGYIGPGEEPLHTARRELLEETGYEASGWRALGAFTVDGNRGNGCAYYFLAEGAVKVAEPDSGDLEEIRLELVPLAEIKQKLATGISTLDAAAIVGLALLSGVADRKV